MKHTSDIKRKNQRGGMKRSIKKAIHFISDKEQSLHQKSDGFIQHIKDLIEFSHNELDNYFDNVTIHDTRINLY
ncbi:MAG: hypothetical protein H7259_02755 [Cytophagales bacterium]|nr:hypothetical protein [Cytophaga sp.]